MKHLVLLFCFFLATNSLIAQNSYTINGESLELKTELEGKLDLLWNTFDGQFRYFVRRSDGNILELKNTKDSNNKYLEEYKKVLADLTKDQSLSTEKLKLTLYGLKAFIDDYNTISDSSYISQKQERGLQFRLGISGGITNNPFVSNPDNKNSLLLGGELEMFESKIPRHAGFFQIRHAFESDDFMYSTTELSLGYRYRVINASKFSLYGQFKFATLNFSNVTITDENNMELDISDTAFDVPFIFGVGADFKISENSYITLIYGELFAILIDNQGNFSTDISIGYKLNL